MQDKQLHNEAFFLTSQTANLMEDFERELNTKASMYLLYGESMVGKSDFLKELVRTRLKDKKVHWIDCGVVSVESDGQRSNKIGNNGLLLEIEQIALNATQNEIIIVDHFESASNKVRHHLFQSWAKEGVDKNLNVIIASGQDDFEAIRQLAQQYQVSVNSTQLMPYNLPELEAFLGFYLFADDATCSIRVLPAIRMQLKGTGGVVGKIKELAINHNDQFKKVDHQSSTGQKSYRLQTAAVFIILLFIGGLGLLEIYRPDVTIPVKTSEEIAAAGIPAQAIPAQAIPAQVIPALVIPDQVIPEPAIQEQGISSRVIPQSQSDKTVLELETENSRPELLATGPAIKKTELQDPRDIKVKQEITIPKVEKKSRIVKVDEEIFAKVTNDDVAEIETRELSEPEKSIKTLPEKFDDKLNTTLDWLNRSDRSLATLQIMSISIERFTASAYNDYINKLDRNGVDTKLIRIYQSELKGAQVYSAVYSEYKNRTAARLAVQNLPNILKRQKPFPRTIGGILDEISR